MTTRADQSTSDLAKAQLPHAIAGGLEIVAVRALRDVDEARDAVQETMVRALEAIRRGRVPSGVPIEAFAYGIARHVIADVHRRRARDGVQNVDPGSLHAPDPSPLEALIQREERELMARALSALPSPDRDLLERCFVGGERVAAIAAQLGEPADRIRKRKSRAVERLREHLRRPASGHETVSPPIVAT